MTDASDVEEKRICWRCIGESFLKAKVRKSGEQGDCSYCGVTGKTVSIAELAEDISGAFARHYTLTPAGPSDHEYMMYKESDLSWERVGEPAAYAIAAAAGLAEEPAEHVRAVLEVSHGRTYDNYFEEGEDEFSEESHYDEIRPDASDLYHGWHDFKKSLRTEARFFNSTAKAKLDQIFAGLDGHATRTGRKVIVDAGPGQKLSGLYRARLFHSDEKLAEAMKRPDLDLGPPPPSLAVAGRMNARGIAVFYGSTHADVALAETRPPVGSYVLVGRFELVRALKLLDVEALRSIFVKGSVFDTGHADRLKKASFLATLSSQITQPVMPDDEPFEYLVTQAIADYLASLSEPPLDGIIYPSVQDGKKEKNVVLFHKSSKVTLLDIPPGTMISAHVTSNDEEGPIPDYWVFETVPAAEDKDDPDFDLPSMEFADGERRPENDGRMPTLSIDIKSLQVHHISRAAYASERFTVARHRTQISKRIVR